MEQIYNFFFSYLVSTTRKSLFQRSPLSQRRRSNRWVNPIRYLARYSRYKSLSLSLSLSLFLLQVSSSTHKIQITISCERLWRRKLSSAFISSSSCVRNFFGGEKTFFRFLQFRFRFSRHPVIARADSKLTSLPFFVLSPIVSGPTPTSVHSKTTLLVRDV